MWWCVCRVVCGGLGVVVCVQGGVGDAVHVLVRMTLGRSHFPRGMSPATIRSRQCSPDQ